MSLDQWSFLQVTIEIDTDGNGTFDSVTLSTDPNQTIDWESDKMCGSCFATSNSSWTLPQLRR
ncbi:MAG: hypothetical protein R3B96_02345 [Pirellulaceae bacterium]